MCHEYGSNHWHRLTPDINGSYVNGTWSNLADMTNGTDTSGCTSCTYAPVFYASAVLPDGRVVVIGGEYNTNGQTWTDIGFKYDPKSNAWSTQLSEPFGTGNVGDAQAVVLQSGTMLLANISNGNIAAFNPSTLTFSALNPTGKLSGDKNDEENWHILPDGRVLTVDAWIASSFELYNPTTNIWSSGTTPVNLADTGTGTGNSREVGPAVLRPDGKLIYFSGNPAGQNAVYDTGTGTWSHAASMDFPIISGQQYAVADGPASLLPNGNVLVMASPVSASSTFNTPSHLFEFDGTNLTQLVTDPPNAASFISYQGRMLLLPSGEVLFTAFNQDTISPIEVVRIYSNGGGPQNAWRPIITSAPGLVAPGGTYTITGKQFNGFSEGASYGDDAQMSTNYPLVRITNDVTGHVFYARTHDHTRMGVEAVGSPALVSTQVDVASSTESGSSHLVVVANGIPSSPAVPIVIQSCASLSCTSTNNCNTVTSQTILTPDNAGVTVYANLRSTCHGVDLKGCKAAFVITTAQAASQTAKCQGIVDALNSANSGCASAGYMVTNNCATNQTFIVTDPVCTGSVLSLGISNNPNIFDQEGQGPIPDYEEEIITPGCINEYPRAPIDQSIVHQCTFGGTANGVGIEPNETSHVDLHVDLTSVGGSMNDIEVATHPGMKASEIAAEVTLHVCSLDVIAFNLGRSIFVQRNGQKPIGVGCATSDEGITTDSRVGPASTLPGAAGLFAAAVNAIPTLSEWGIITLVVLMGICGALLIVRR